MGFMGVLKGLGKARQAVSGFKNRGGLVGAAERQVTQPRPADPESVGFLHGGKVKKKGMYKLHAGERVLSKKQTKKWEK
jgi:hypothetical protein